MDEVNYAIHFKFHMEENVSVVLLKTKPDKNKSKRGNGGGEGERHMNTRMVRASEISSKSFTPD